MDLFEIRVEPFANFCRATTCATLLEVVASAPLLIIRNRSRISEQIGNDGCQRDVVVGIV
jgi:hypothetical protein